MSTKADLTQKDKQEKALEIVKFFGSLEKVQIFWKTHSRRMIETFAKETFNISHYYMRDIVLNILKLCDRTATDSKVINKCNRDRTNIKKYGRVNVGQFGSEEFKAALLNKYGVDNYSKTEAHKQHLHDLYLGKHLSCEVKQKISKTVSSTACQQKTKQTMLNKYGVDSVGLMPGMHNRIWNIEVNNRRKNSIYKTFYKKYGCWAVQSDIVRTKLKKKYTYNNICFDSSWELALWIYAKDHNEEIAHEPVKFKYTVANKIHYYFPDFYYKNQLIEIKGTHLLTKNNTLKATFNMSEDLVKAKQQCMVENNVKLWTYTDIKFALTYIKVTYGKDYLKQFKNK